MIFPEVAEKVTLRLIWSPGLTGTLGKLNVVSPAAVASAVARTVPLTEMEPWPVTVESGSICTSAWSREATPEGTVNVCEAVPPGTDRLLPGLPRHIAYPAFA